MKKRAEVVKKDGSNERRVGSAADRYDEVLELSDLVKMNELVSIVIEVKVAKCMLARKEEELEVLTTSVIGDMKMCKTKIGTRTERRSVKFAFESRKMFERVEEMACFDGSEADLRESEGFELFSKRENGSKEHEVVGHFGVLL